MKAIIVTGALVLAISTHSLCSQLEIKLPASGISTTSGVVVGHAAPNISGVTEYLGIPYAGPTSGSRRWLPPQRFNSTGTFNASTYGPSCPANIGGTVAFPNKTPQFDNIYLAFTTQGGNVQSEDCLSLNIWVKDTLKLAHPKPVLVFLPGGRWNLGGSKSLFYNGKYLADAENVIVVTINYRLNIFGFPGAPGITANLGLLDQRLALEWLRDNIGAFGGDCDRIIVFGQSAGSVSVGYLAYSYPDDPIVAGYIMHSGTPHSWTPETPDVAAAHWYNASSFLGCGSTGDVLECMKAQNTSAILAAVAKNPFDPSPALLQPQFQPKVDNVTVFPNYTQLAATGKLAKLPVLVGNTNHESGFYQIAAFATNRTFNTTQQSLFNLAAFTCATAIEASARATQDVPVWRYRYFGEFTNLELFPRSGAYHGSDLNMVFGTAQDTSGLLNTAVENATSRYLMHVWATFARDPKRGLVDELGWPTYDSNAATLIRLGFGNETSASFVDPSSSDAECAALGGENNLGKGAM